MTTEHHQISLKTLARSDSFNDWLRGTQYSENYINTLRLKTKMSPIPTLRSEKSAGKPNIKSKSKCRMSPAGASQQESDIAVLNSSFSKTSDNYSRGGSFQVNLATLPCGSKETTLSQKENSTALRNSGAALEHADTSFEDISVRDLLWGSYNRIKKSNAGVFPALLTPYQRSFWSYKSVKNEKDSLSDPSKVVPQNGHSSDLTLLKITGGILDVPLNERPDMFRRHHSTGPPSFAPTRSASRWLRNLR